MFSSLENWPTYLNDGVHPTIKGYEKIAQYVAPILNRK